MCLPSPLWSLYHKVNARAGRLMFPSNRSGPVSDSLFWQKHKIQWWLLSSEAGENTVIKIQKPKGNKGKVYVRPSPYPNCSESGKLWKRWGGKPTNLMTIDGLEAARFIPELLSISLFPEWKNYCLYMSTTWSLLGRWECVTAHRRWPWRIFIWLLYQLFI